MKKMYKFDKKEYTLYKTPPRGGGKEGDHTMSTFIPEGVCSKQIEFEVENGNVKNVTFVGGCPGNLKAISKLVDGMPVQQVIGMLKGNVCRNGTSCTDQLAKALEQEIK